MLVFILICMLCSHTIHLAVWHTFSCYALISFPSRYKPIHLTICVDMRSGKGASFTNPLADDIFGSEKVPFLALNFGVRDLADVSVWKLLSKANSSDKRQPTLSWKAAISRKCSPLSFNFHVWQEDFHMGNGIRNIIFECYLFLHTSNQSSLFLQTWLPPQCYLPFVFTPVTLLVKPRFMLNVTPSAGLQNDSVKACQYGVPFVSKMHF